MTHSRLLGDLAGTVTREPMLWADAEAASVAPSERLRVLGSHRSDPSHSWLDIGGNWFFLRIRRMGMPVRMLRRRAGRIVEFAETIRPLDDAALRAHLLDLARTFRLSGAGDEAGKVKDDAFAGIFLAVERIHGFSPHVEQIMGALALLDGRMVEMATGEGKTLTAAMAAIASAWRGLPCHVVTANDYLAARDAGLEQQLFAFCHVSAASVVGDMPPQTRAAAYGHDIVYSTAKELLGDHLRDGLALGRTPSRSRFSLAAARNRGRMGGGNVVMRGLHQVIVDEADSVLIDEAVTPLIISAQHPDDFLNRAAHEAVEIARQLAKKRDYTLERALRHVELTAAGIARIEEISSGLAPFWRHRDRARELVEMALYARELLVRDQHYVIEQGKVVLVDELTGRLARQRTLSLGMQQILEASENLEISPPNEVSARLSFQRFFRLFSKLGGMTGTAQEARGEFARVYRLFTLRIPTHRPVRRAAWPLEVCDDEAEKFGKIASSALELMEKGRAVLVGMRSVRSSEALFHHIHSLRPNINISVLHAIHHEQESSIVASAGQSGALTIATNMAGRGTDIVLAERVREQGGLHVIIGESNDFCRIDRQLIGRCARQGDPGSAQRFVALDDDLFRRFLPEFLKNIGHWQRRNLPAWDRYAAAGLLWFAQWRAERLAFRQRQGILKQDIEFDRSGF